MRGRDREELGFVTGEGIREGGGERSKGKEREKQRKLGWMCRRSDGGSKQMIDIGKGAEAKKKL